MFKTVLDDLPSIRDQHSCTLEYYMKCSFDGIYSHCDGNIVIKACLVVFVSDYRLRRRRTGLAAALLL